MFVLYKFIYHMLQICPKCHSAYNVNDKCPHCSFWERNNELLKYIEGNNWIDGSFEDLKLCTEGWFHTCNVVLNTKREDTRFPNRDLKEEKVGTFKLSLNSHQNPKIIIEQTPPFKHDGREMIVRKPYIEVVFDEDAEEEYISLDTFRSSVAEADSITTNERKRKLLPSLFSRDCTYEVMYNRLNEQKYKFYKLVCSPRLVINDFVFCRSCLYITDADMSY